MPTFRNWKTKSGYGIVANLPDAPHPFTYQLKPRAVEFYKQLEYESYDDIDGRLVWPLRKLGDLYIGGEEQPSDDETKELPTIGDLDKFSFTDSEKRALAQYVRDHPRSTEAIRSDLNERLFDGGFDFSGENTDVQSESERKDSIENCHSLPTDIVEHIDGWVNWERLKERSYNPSNRKDFLEDVAEIPGAVESVRDFAGHPSPLKSFSQTGETLSYRFAFEQGTLPDWICDDHRFDHSDTDFSICLWLDCHPIQERYSGIIHKFDIVDGYTTNWEVILTTVVQSK